MSEPITTQPELLKAIEGSWRDLNAALEMLSADQMTGRQDAQGWTVKDHLTHLAAWERSVVFLLQSQPRHEGLGIDEPTYLKGDDDEINDVIFQQHRALPLAEVMAHFRQTHQELLHLLQGLTDEDLQLRYRHYLPDEPGDGDGSTAVDIVYGNSADHFKEHLSWIEALVNR